MRSLTDRPVERAVRMVCGLALFGFCLAMLVKADLGADPWTVLTQGVARLTGLSLGQVVIGTSLLLLLLWIPLRQRPGPGTFANALLVGPFLDLGMAWIPDVHQMAARIALLVAAIPGVAVATGLYMGAGLGAGPRDGVMTGLAERGTPVGVARAGIELSVLIVGRLLGGSVGVATVAFALAIGPLVGYFLPRLRIR
ncbi:YitT family protein [Streptomyces sp. NPDC102406]|uniref:membrane protein YczE n=1 Tax=Streptomyces sp. NPDC102406 TaxID=3366171 RepID=UPI0038086E67